ncbi:MAG: peptide ABC transporter substrate-binding protein [Saccharofermentanales bacterium]
MTKRVLFLLLAVVLTLSFFTGCGIKKTESINVNIGPEPESIDPANNEAVDGASLIVHAFEGIYTLDKAGLPQLGQAKKVEISADKKTYTITLRSDIKWSDGQPVKAGDFVYAWKRAIDKETAAPYGYMLDVIAGVADYMYNDKGTVDSIGVKAIDDTTLEVKLAAPCPYFKELLAFPTYSPLRKDIVDGNEGWATSPATYIGNGPYKLESWTHNSEMVYVKNQNYYDVKKLGPERIKFVLMDDDNAILAAFKNGEILFADSIPNDEIDALKSTPEFNKKGQLGTYFLAFQTQKAPFNNAKVRKALSLAIDRNFIAEKIGKAGQVPAGAFVPIGMAGKDPKKEFREEGGDYYSVDAAKYNDNVAEAKQLLTEAGYPGGAGFPKFEYIYNTGSGHQAIAEALQDMWKTKLGVDCTLASQEWAVFTQTRQDGNYQVSRHGWLGDYNDPITFLDMWKTGGGNNDAKWSNTSYDALIDKIKSTDDRDIRYTAMHEAEDILLAEMPIVPIYYYVDLFLKKTNLEGFYSSPLGYKYFMYTYLK